jgi:trehalose synthase
LSEIMDYAPFVGEESIRELYSLSEGVQDKVIQSINSTSEGGGVAEILSRIIPLLRQMGVDATWDVLKGDDAFFKITKKFHNALQGMNECISSDELAHFLEVNRRNADEMDLYGDIMFIHDPQPIALIEKKNAKAGKKWIWRCHIDLTGPQSDIMDFLRSYMERYDRIVISSPKYARKDIGVEQAIIPPSIDPLSDKNRELPGEMVDLVLDQLGIDRSRPIISQISRFDRFKNPCGVIEVYKKVKKYKDIQLVLAGGGATDDPEGPGILEQLKDKVECDPDIHIIDLPPYSDIEINALQRASTVILQNSSREGFGLTVTEALWKARPVIASAVGGIPLQICHEHSGILSHSLGETEAYLRKLLDDPEYATRLGINGKEHVRNNFLITRHIRDCLILFNSLNCDQKSLKALGGIAK